MIRLNNDYYKVIYLDTNILRATLEMSEDIHLGALSLLGKKSIYAISIITLVEFSHKAELLESFKKFIHTIPLLILKPFKQILQIELEKRDSNVRIDDLILLISNPLQPQVMNEICEYLESDTFFATCKLLKEDQTETYQRIEKEIESERDFICSPEEFVRKRISAAYNIELNYTLNDRKILSLKIVNLLLYYTYKERRKKAERSAPFDFLISSAVPYVDMFITENSQAKSLELIKQNHKVFRGIDIKVMKDLRNARKYDA